MNKQKEYFLLLLIMSICGYLISLCLYPGHNWGSDYALYLSQAKSILNSTELELFNLNKFAMDNSIRPLGPYLYPFGYPLLLCPVYAIFGLNFMALKIYNAAFLLLSIPVLYFLFKNYLKDKIYLLFVVLLIAFHKEFVTFADYLYSDFAYFLISNCCFLLMLKRKNYKNQLLLGCCVFLSYFIRDTGIVLLPTLLVFQFSDPEKGKNKFLLNAIPFIVFIFFFAIVNIVLPHGGENHFKMLLSDCTFSAIAGRLHFYLQLLEIYLFTVKVHLRYFLPVIFIVFTGIYSTRKINPHFIVYTFLTAVLLLIWPATQGTRFLYPVLPFMLYYLLTGCIYWVEKIKLKENYFKMLVVLIILFSSFQNINQIIEVSSFNTNQACSPEMEDVYGFIIKNIPEKQVIGFFKPRGLRLFTDRNAIFTDEFHFQNSVANYLLINKNEKYIPVTSQNKIYESEHFVLLRKVQ